MGLEPLLYSALSGGALYSLLARDYAPLEQRLLHVAARLEEFPRLLEEIRATLEPARVPRIHAQTAISQNLGVHSILDNQVVPDLDLLGEEQRGRLERGMETGRAAIDQHQQWLEKELLPAAKGDFRISTEFYDTKLRFALQSTMDRAGRNRRPGHYLQLAHSNAYPSVLRAQLTSAQLPTYFVGFLEHSDIRSEVERAEGEAFDLLHYHDKVLSFGAPPLHYVRALMLDLPITRPGAS